MSEIFAGQLTAVATLALAVLALATAVLALLAWRKQSKEVSDQGEMLELQRKQLEEQQRTSANQAKVLGLQAEDLRESISERERLRNATERIQADEIGFQMTSTTFPFFSEEDGGGDFSVDPGETVHMFIVSNRSQRPIKNVECRIGGSAADFLFPETHGYLPVLVGRLAVLEPSKSLDPQVFDPSLGPSARAILPGEEYGFVFELKSHRFLGLSPVTATFTDDAGLQWQIDSDQHLERLPNNESGKRSGPGTAG